MKLASLYEVLSGKTVGGKQHAAPKSNMQKIGNLMTVLTNFQNDGVRVDITAQDLVDVKETMVLGFIWGLIRKYGKVESNELLLNSLKRLCTHYGIPEIESLNPKFFQDGLMFCAIVHSNAPSAFLFSSVDKAEPKQRVSIAFDAASDHLKVGKMLEVDDVLTTNLDSDSIVAYVSNFNLKLESLPNPSENYANEPKKEVPPPAPVAPAINWEAKYNEEHKRSTHLQVDVDDATEKIQRLLARLAEADNERKQMEEEQQQQDEVIDSLRATIKEFAGDASEASEEVLRMQEEHKALMEEMKRQEEEKNRELERLKEEQRELSERSKKLESELEEMNEKYRNDEKLLMELHEQKRALDEQIEAMRERIMDQEQSNTDLTVQTEELKLVLSNLMIQLEGVVKEEQKVDTRKKGQDRDREVLQAQLEKAQKEKKELEKKHEKAVKELDKIKKNRETEIKRLKKRVDEVQKAGISRQGSEEQLRLKAQIVAKDTEIDELKLRVTSLEEQLVVAQSKPSNDEMSELLRKSEENLKSLQGAYLAALDEIQALGEAEALRKETEEKMAEMKAQEEEKNREMERLKQESLKMEEEKAALERQMDEMNAKYMADVKQLNELGSQKRQLETEIDVLRSRLDEHDQSQTDLVTKHEEMKEVLASLMLQLENVKSEEQKIDTRKRGKDSDRDGLSLQLEKVQKEKKEIEKQNEKAQKELEKLKKNSDAEIKKLKKRMEDMQKAQAEKKKEAGKEGEKMREQIREQIRIEVRKEYEASLRAGEEQERRAAEKRAKAEKKEAEKKLAEEKEAERAAERERLVQQLEDSNQKREFHHKQLLVLEEEVKQAKRASLKMANELEQLRIKEQMNIQIAELELKWNSERLELTKKADVAARNMDHYKERKKHYKIKYRKTQAPLTAEELEGKKKRKAERAKLRDKEKAKEKKDTERKEKEKKTKEEKEQKEREKEQQRRAKEDKRREEKEKKKADEDKRKSELETRRDEKKQEREKAREEKVN